jgi:CheY-like chemotaxis protein
LQASARTLLQRAGLAHYKPYKIWILIKGSSSSKICLTFLNHLVSSLKNRVDQMNSQQSLSSKQCIMVLDDDFDISLLIKQILQKHHFKNVFAFTDPLLALEHFRINHKDYSLIISDIRMPTMNGFQFVSEARKINPKVKILLMTAFEINDKEFARALPKQKIDGLIRKPATSQEILNTVSTVTKR